MNNPSTPAKQLVVLGMHRSGTSAITGALEAMGFFVGDEEDLTSTSWQNPRGFYERRDARTICDDLLHRSDADWWKVSRFDPDNAPHQAVSHNMELIRELVNELDSHGKWVLKEPRLCLLLPIFRSALRDPVIVHIVRDPVEVAKSLKKRNGIPLRVGIALWETYNIAAIRNSMGMPRICINYHDLVAEPDKQLKHVAAELKRAGVNGLDVESAVASVDPGLHRETDLQAEHAALLYPNQKKLWNWLAAGQVDKVPYHASRVAMLTLEEYEPEELERKQYYQVKIKELSAEVKNRQTKLEEQREAREKLKEESARKIEELKAAREKTKAELGKKVDELKAALEKTKAESGKKIEQLEKAKAESDRKIEQLENARAESDNKIKQLTDALEQNKAESARLTNEVKRRDQSIEELKQNADRQTREIAELSRLLLKTREAWTKELERARQEQRRANSVTKQLAKVRNSRMWRATAPFRAVGVRVKRLVRRK